MGVLRVLLACVLAAATAGTLFLALRQDAAPPLRAAPRAPAAPAADAPQHADALRSAEEGEAEVPVTHLRNVAEHATDGGERVNALAALNAAGFVVRDHVAALLALLGRQWPVGVRLRALRLLSELDPPAKAKDALPDLRRLVRSESPLLRLAAVRTAASLRGSDWVVDFLLNCLRGRDADTTAVAAALLGRFPRHAARIVPDLVDAMLGCERARHAACSSLRQLLRAAPQLRESVWSTRNRAGPDGLAQLQLLMKATKPPVH